MCKFIVSIILLFVSLNLYADSDDSRVFQRIFTNWTNAFNRKELPQSCALFARSLVADYQGTPQKSYSSICNSFKTIFQDKKRRFEYKFKLHDVFRSGDLAAIRITWYLRIYENGKIISNTHDEGIDIFKLNQGKWEIVSYIAYPVLTVE